MPKILILRFSSIGDIVLTSPVVRCIKQQVPGAEVHFATKKRFHTLIESNPYIDKCHFLNGDFKGLIKALKKEKFDYVIDLHNNLRTFKIKLSLGVKHYSFKKLNIQKWLLVRFKVNLLPKIHIVDRYLQAAAHLGVVNDHQGLDYFIPEKDKVALSSLPETHRQGFIVFSIGGQHATKKMPLRRLISICKLINRPVVLVGGKTDIETGFIISNSLGKNIYNASGIYNLNQSASLISMAEKVITHDTGMMHIAAALKKPVISLWGNTIPEFGMTPYLPGEENKNIILEVKDLNCRPCSKIGHSSCPKKHFNCMNLIDNQLIIEAVAKDYSNS